MWSLTLFQVLVDSPGTLKYSDFSLARLEGEDLAAIYAEAVGNSEDGTEDKSKVAPSGERKEIFLIL